jgi:hypothetical protein
MKKILERKRILYINIPNDILQDGSGSLTDKMSETLKDKKKPLLAEIASLEAELKMLQESDAEEQAKIIAANSYKPDPNCNATTTVCILWEKSEGELPARGRGIAYRNSENEHYAEVKTQGFMSNTLVTIVHNDTIASELLGDGQPGGNIVFIKQNTGLRKK